MPILTSACATRPWWVNEWLVIDVGEIFSFLLINNKLGVPGVASYRGQPCVHKSIQPTNQVFWASAPTALTYLPPGLVTVGQRKKVTAVTFFPVRPRSDQRGTNRGQIRKVPLYEITWFLVHRMGATRSQLGANNGNLVCLVREIWQFKLIARKEVTAVPATRGEGGYWRRGRKLLGLCWNWIALSFLNIGNKMIAYVSPVGDLYQ